MKQKLAAKEEDTAEDLRKRMTFFQRYCTSRFYVLFIRMEGSIKQGLSRRRNPNFQPIRSHRVCQDSIWASRSCRNLGSGTSGHQLEVLTLLTACILKKWKWVEFWYKFLKLVGGNMVGYTKLFHAAEFVHKHMLPVVSLSCSNHFREICHNGVGWITKPTAKRRSWELSSQRSGED
ncbi:uncharacterized protein LOC113330630 isoform X2 [Papaver somniferum]|uniref:uncharacterized protein LOC113330630 isoform X2 n=1 Tax=Papaver somniferum TaxID=3469 RepID=UPI000E705B92|nr:uncharacterized protein LOC113330630 isoform X2 [Papaver somniferum]